ncbi:MAG: restriction endonuclease [Flexibacter sp. CG_4_10_14_3_um_filter_32_15]|nr:MAG: restriction endonuclease [Flexibacter sp. CG_4_10_14_3_um_filter_32_15]
MITSLDQLDFNKTYSYADYLTWQFEEFVELIKGKVMPMSAPSRSHQKISIFLSKVLVDCIENNHLECEVYAAPFDVRLLKNPNECLENRIGKTDKEIYTVVQPDLCVICDLEKLDDRGCNGAPELIIEIVSEKSAVNANRDVIEKYAIYAENGVVEYWLVRPLEKTVQKNLLNLATHKYEVEGFYGINDTVFSTVLPSLEVEINYVLR